MFDFGNHLRMLRERYGISQEELGRRVGRAGSVISNYENNIKIPTLDVLTTMARIYNVSLDYLVGFDKKDQVILSAEGFGGSSLYGEKDFVNLKVFDDVIGQSGLGSFSLTELSKALAGKIANVNLSMDGLYTHASGSSTPKDVETMLQMLYLYFTNINKDQKSFDNLIKQYEVALKDRALSPDVALGDSLTATMYGHNPRLKPLVTEDLPQISYDRILQMAKERTANAAGWTFTLVGNFEEDSIRPLICQYIASLPAQGKIVKGKRTAFMQKGEIVNEFKRKQETPKSTAYMMWHNEDMPYTLENSIRADMAGQILSMIYLKKIREDAGAAYSVGAQGTMTRLDDKIDCGIFAYCPMKYEMADTVLTILRAEVEAMATSCDGEMLEKVKEFMLKSYDDATKTNSYWLGVIDTYRTYGTDLHSAYRQTVAEQSTQSVSAFVKQLISQGNRAEVTMMPALGDTK